MMFYFHLNSFNKPGCKISSCWCHTASVFLYKTTSATFINPDLKRKARIWYLSVKKQFKRHISVWQLLPSGIIKRFLYDPLAFSSQEMCKIKMFFFFFFVENWVQQNSSFLNPQINMILSMILHTNFELHQLVIRYSVTFITFNKVLTFINSLSCFRLWWCGLVRGSERMSAIAGHCLGAVGGAGPELQPLSSLARQQPITTSQPFILQVSRIRGCRGSSQPIETDQCHKLYSPSIMITSISN